MKRFKALFLSLEEQHPSATGMVLGSFAVCIWGAYLALSRYALSSSSLESIDVAFIRGTVAGLTMLAWLLLSFKRNAAALLKVSLPKALVLAVLVGPPFVITSVQGYAYAPLVHGGVFLPAGLVIAGPLLAAFFLGEGIDRNKIIGAMIILVGLVILAGPSFFEGGHEALFGDMLFFIAGMMWASFAVLQKYWRVSPVVATAYVSLASLFIYGPGYYALYGWERLQQVDIGVIVVQAIVQGVFTGVIAMICFGTAVRLIGASKTSMFPALVPVTTLLIGIPLTNEYLTLAQTLGTLTVLSGLFFSIFLKRRTNSVLSQS